MRITDDRRDNRSEVIDFVHGDLCTDIKIDLVLV